MARRALRPVKSQCMNVLVERRKQSVHKARGSLSVMIAIQGREAIKIIDFDVQQCRRTEDARVKTGAVTNQKHYATNCQPQWLVFVAHYISISILPILEFIVTLDTVSDGFR